MKKFTVLALFAFLSFAAFTPEAMAQKPVKQKKMKAALLTAPEIYVFELEGVFSILEDKQDAADQFVKMGFTTLKIIHVENNIWEPLRNFEYLSKDTSLGPEETSPLIREIDPNKLVRYKLPLH